MSAVPRSQPVPTGQPDVAFDRDFDVTFRHRLRFTHGVFDEANRTLAALLPAGGPALALVVVDDGVAAAWSGLASSLTKYQSKHADLFTLAGSPIVVPGGEAAKQDRSVVDLVTQEIERAGLCRHSFVFAIGGGAVLDAVGYAAATAHRGVRLIRFPTTTLGQGDAGIGVKNGINWLGKKNFVGTFDVPWAVVNDAAFLATLSDRDWRSGLSEAVKVALLKDPNAFEQIERGVPALARRDAVTLEPIIRRSAELHLDHITQGGDPFERERARPLDFGHWSAHRIESLSRHGLRHGEAVAIGLALDVAYSTLTGLLPAAVRDRILACLTGVGFRVYDETLARHEEVIGGLEEFRQHLGGRLTLTLLRSIGEPVDVHDVDSGRMIEAIEFLADVPPPSALSG